jgi:predicted amidohydrolase
VRRALLLAAALLGLAAAPASAETVRAFAVGPKFSLDWVESRETFRGKLLALVDARERTAERPSIQRGADDVASHLRGGGRDLVVFPEDLGLMAAFTGERGRGARGSGGLVEAIVTLIGSYAPVNAYYAAKYPALAQRPVPTRLLGISLTDTFGRVAVETSAELADRLDAYVVQGVNMARDWRIVCNDKASFQPLPGGVGCDEQDPARVMQLRAPDEPERTYAYEATTSEPVNMALVFDPEGKLIAKQVKTYLTPIELPGAGLDLVPGQVTGGLTSVDTPLGRLGIVISKDAWMPDVLAKLDHRRVDVLLQPEFFVGNTIKTSGIWAADTIATSGHSDLMRMPSFESLVLPALTGNVFDFSADNQSAIAVKPRAAGGPSGRLVGQDLQPGYTDVAPWLVPDPVDHPLAERRRILGEAGEKALPNGPACPRADEPGPCAGGQVEAVLWEDIEVRRTPAYRRTRTQRRGRRPFSPNRAIAPSRLPQRGVTLAARGRRVWAAFEQGDGRLVVACSHNRGRRWRRVRLGAGAWPSISLGPGGEVWIAFQRDRDGVPRTYVGRSSGHGRSFRTWPVGGPDEIPQWRPSIAATGRGRAYVAWVDERERQPEDGLRRADVFGAPVTIRGPGEAARLDRTAATNDLAAKLDNDWAPHVAARGDRVVVTWLDFRDYDWDVLSRESTDGGDTFGAARIINGTDDALEALNDVPRAAIDERGRTHHAWMDFRKTSDPAPPNPLYDIRVDDRVVDGHDGTQVRSFAPSLAWPFLAWQDHPRGVGEIRLRRAGGRRILRVQDAGARGNAWRPAVAVSGRRVVVAWEDERDGPPQIYASFTRAAKIR